MDHSLDAASLVKAVMLARRCLHNQSRIDNVFFLEQLARQKHQ
jgi:hypothetical protein